ncbi:MAG TPA: biopolymer transporter ExbD [Eoetvoesiella sp.]|uniref:ExbD/TolR family protein n=1 Tax=Eoetvoesiella sp. TaxID=1966355 RepID=UPI002C7A59FA|nr:biopolymer transporter ExbD [Eoetvoesiella sp.]HWK60927.1 biopolymer transporter ExbD [Eoetvoesiella sp.]
MNFRRRKTGGDELEINLIPLIDVLLVIVIFLTATTTFTRIRQLKIDLPQAQADSTPNAEAIDIAVSQDGLYALDGNLIAGRDIADIAAALRDAVAAGKEPTLVINADALSSHESVVRVMEAARQADIHRINFATQSPH